MSSRARFAAVVALMLMAAACAPTTTPTPRPPTDAPALSPPAPSPSTASSSSSPALGAFGDWVRADLPTPASDVVWYGYAVGIVRFQGGYLAAGTAWPREELSDPSHATGVVWTSSDGRSWELREARGLEHASPSTLVTDGSRLILAGTIAAPEAPTVEGPAAWASSDGTTWTRSTGLVPTLVAGGQQRLIGAATAEDGSGKVVSFQFVSSQDGLSWRSVSKAYEVHLADIAVASDGTALAIGSRAGSEADGWQSTRLMTWRSDDGTSWSEPTTLPGDARPVKVTAAGDGFLTVVGLPELYSSGGVNYVNRLWEFDGGEGPLRVAIPIGEEEYLNSAYALNDSLVAIGETGVNHVSNPLVWISTDGGHAWDLVKDSTFSGSSNYIEGVVEIPGGLAAIGRRWNGSDGPFPAFWLAAR